MPLFKKRQPSKDELRRALDNKDRIVKMYTDGDLPSVIARKHTLPTLAVEYVLKKENVLKAPPPQKTEESLDIDPSQVMDFVTGTDSRMRAHTQIQQQNPPPVQQNLTHPGQPQMGFVPQLHTDMKPPAAAEEQEAQESGGKKRKSETVDVDRKMLRKPGMDKAASEIAGEQQKPEQVMNDPMAHEFPDDLGFGGRFPTMATFGAQQVPGQAMPAAELAGVFEVPLAYKTLFYTLTELGAKPEMARGIVRLFRFYSAEDYVALDEILKDAGLAPGIRRLVVKSWRMAGEDTDAQLPSGEAAQGISADTEEGRQIARKRLNRLKQEMGINTPGDINAEIEDLEKQRMMVEIDEAKERLKQMKKGPQQETGDDETIEVLVSMNGVPVKKTIRQKDYHIWEPVIVRPGPKADGGDDAVEVMLDINGVRAKKHIRIDDIGKWEKYIVREDAKPKEGELTKVVIDLGGIPVEKTVRTDELHLYAPYVKRAQSQQSAGEPTPEMTAIRKQVSELADIISQDRAEKAREREEAKREREFSALRQEISELRSAGSRRTDDPVEKRMNEMEKQMQAQRDEVYRQQMAGMKETLDAYRQEISGLREQMGKMNNFDYAIEQQHRFDQMARKQGYVGPAEAQRITEDDISLEDQRNTVKRKDEAQARALNILGDKVEKTGDLKNAFINKGGADVIVDTLKRMTTSKEEQEAQMYTPSPADLARKVEEMERTEAQRRPVENTQPPPPPAPPPMEQPAEQPGEEKRKFIGDRARDASGRIDIA